MHRILCLFILGSFAATPLLAKEAWKKVAVEDGITIYNRDVKGGGIKELMAVGTINAEPWVVKNVIDDVGNYTKFMPYTKISTIVSKDEKKLVNYQLLDMPMVSNRDYVIEIQDLSTRDDAGNIIYLNKWKTKANAGHPPVDDAVRVVQNTGYWELQKRKDGKTKATYYIFTNPGGSIPNFIINKANTTAIPAVFEAVRKRVKNPSYRKYKHALESAPAESTPAESTP